MTSVARFFRGCLIEVVETLFWPTIICLAMLVPLKAAHADTATVLPFRELTTPTPVGHAVNAIPPGAQAAPLISYDTTPFVPATSADAALAPASGDVFDPANPSTQFLLLPAEAVDEITYQDAPGVYVTYRIVNEGVIAEVLQADAPGYTLYLGLDSNGDGKAQADETLCTSVSTATSPARCVYRPQDAAHAGFGTSFWAIVQAPAGTNPVNHATLSGGINYYSGNVFPNPSEPSRAANSDGATVTLGPGSVAAGRAFSLRTTWLKPLFAHQRYYSAILMGSSYSLVAQSDIVLPFALTYTAEQPNAQWSLLPDPSGNLPYSAKVLVEPGQSLTRLFFDLPPADHYDRVAIVVAGDALRSSDADVYVARADLPVPSDSPVIAEAPPASSAVVAWNPASSSPSVGIIDQPTAGRWYVVINNPHPSEAVLNVYAIDPVPGTTTNSPSFGAQQTPTLAEGPYFNPKRSGHGIFLSRGADQQVVDWYSFLEDGTPVFYVAQAPAPAANSGWWTATLYRATWNPNSTNFPKIVGEVTLVPTGKNQMLFTWQLEGQTGSESFIALARTGACPTVDGAVTNFGGNWYAPAESGYGIDVLALPEQQFDTFYLYDALGNPTWVIGANGPFATSSSIDLLQSTGFCPVCAWKALTTQAAGSMNISFTDAAHGHLVSAITLNPPLTGKWNVDQPTFRLTGTPACTP